MESTQLRALVEEQLRLSHRLRARIRELEQGQRGTLAIVGMGMRFPGGVTSPDEYWDLLSGDDDGICDIPADRPGLSAVYHPQVGRSGHSYVNRAGFLPDVAGFDADFFGISPREAESLDPQQRLLLETSWEALERAGIAVRREERLDAGVFIGLMAAEYTDRLVATAEDRLDPYFGTGGGHCFAAGRISYALGLSGPAVSLDTACSSSLVALHHAARSLRLRECRYALVGAANLLFSPHLMVSLCQSRALAPDGRSKPFTAAADGYGRGEGVATVVLMRLEDAIQEQRPVLALLRGTAVNHDGAASGLTVPSGPAQQEVIRAALRDAGVNATDVSYVEAHGTGTSLGDPIEAAALQSVYGAARGEAAEPVWVSSVKARLGHLEAASGLAGLMKIVLMLRYDRILADLRDADGALSPRIPWPEYHLKVPRQARAWTGADRIAGISAFGLSGTNAHAVLQAPPPAPVSAGLPTTRPELLVLSARDLAALHALAARVSTHLFRAEPAELAALCHTLRAGRAPMPYRLAVTGATSNELARKLSLAVESLPSEPPTTSARSVVLTTRATAPEQLAKSVAAIAADLPMLAGPDQTPDVEPAAWLGRALTALGLTVKAGPEVDDTEHAAVVQYGNQRIGLVPSTPDRATAVFLEAIAALFRAGAQLRLDALAVPGARFLADVPTYPFQRKRYWVEEPAAVADPQVAATAGPGSAAAHGAATTSATTTSAAVAGAAAEIGGIQEFLHTELAAVLKAEDGLDLRRSFAELGGDSFTAMLFIKSIDDRYGAGTLAEDFAVDRPLAELLGTLARGIAELSAAGLGGRA